MLDQWIGKRVDLDLLAERVVTFFETDFESKLVKSKGRYVIEAVSRIPRLNLKVQVRVMGRPNDFKVEFEAGGKKSSVVRLLGYFAEMFGGGYFLVREAEKREVVDPLERAFWKHVDLAVADLAGSAGAAAEDAPQFVD